MLSDVMKQVVQEVLKGNKTIVSSGPSNRASSAGSTTGLHGIKRPNYQEMKKKQRLSPIKNTNQGRSAVSNNKSNQMTNRSQTTQNRRTQTSGTFSDLNSIRLGQGNVSRRNNSPNVFLNNDAQDAEIIGKTKDGGCVWFFGKLANDLMNHFKRPIQGAAVGIIRMATCMPSQLLLINEMVRSNPELKFHICWEADSCDGFTAELYDTDQNRLKKNMTSIYQQLNRRSMKRVEAYTETAPSPWLSKQLQINETQEAVAILEGTSYYTNIVLMNSLLCESGNNTFSYKINDNYILLQGKEDVISKHIMKLQKDAARLISSDMTV